MAQQAQTTPWPSPPQGNERSDCWHTVAVRVELAEPPPPDRPRAAQVVQLWNTVCAPGTEVRYYPVWGRWQTFEVGKQSGWAFVSRNGLPALKLHGRGGFVSIDHCEPSELDPTAAQRYARAVRTKRQSARPLEVWPWEHAPEALQRLYDGERNAHWVVRTHGDLPGEAVEHLTTSLGERLQRATRSRGAEIVVFIG